MAPFFIRAFEFQNENSYKEVVFDDGFSSLPECIIHHIFSFLGVNDMVKLSVVSKTCCQLCLSSPYMNFNSAPIPRGYPKEPADPTSLLNRLIMERRGDVHSFRLRWACHEKRNFRTEKNRLHKWIRKLVKCNVQELNLELNYPDEYNYITGNCKKEKIFFIDSLVGCASLRVLELNLHGSDLKLPRLILGSLQKLSLQCVIWREEPSLGEWTSTCCPSLTKLELLYIYGVEIIENHTIEELKISLESVSRYDLDDQSPPCLSVFADNLLELDLDLLSGSYEKFSYVEISAPKLQVLSWEGVSLDYTCSDGFKKLTCGTVILDRCYWIEESNFGGLVRLLNSIAYAKVLCLPIALFEALFIKGGMPVHFPNLEELNLYLDGWDGIYIKVISSLLSTMPNLVTLTIRHALDEDGKDRCHEWSGEVEALFKSKASKYYKKMKRSGWSNHSLHMKLLKIEVFDHNDIKLVDYFVRNAYLFEEMIIFYPNPSSADRLSTLTEILVSASSDVTILTVMKPIDIDRYF